MFKTPLRKQASLLWCLCCPTLLLLFFVLIGFMGTSYAQTPGPGTPELQQDTSIPLNIDLDPTHHKPTADDIAKPEDDASPEVDTGGADAEFDRMKPHPSEPSFFLREILLDGVTVFGPEEMSELLSPLVGRYITTTDLTNLVNEVRSFYVRNGYVTTVARIRPGTVSNGTIVIEVFEGRVAQRVVHGQKRTKERFVTGRISLTQGEIFDYSKLEQDLIELNSDPLFKSVRAALKPGAHPATSDIHLFVEEANPFHLSVSVDNGGRHLIGNFRTIMTASHNNLTGNADTLTTSVVLSQNTRTVGVSTQYRFPVSRRHGLTLGGTAGINRVDLDQPFDSPSDVTGLSATYSVFAEKQLYKSRRFNASGDVRFNFYDSKIYVDGVALNDILFANRYRAFRRHPVPSNGIAFIDFTNPFQETGNRNRPNVFEQPFNFDRVRSFSYGISAMEQDAKGRTVMRGSVEHGIPVLGGNRPFTKFNLDVTRLQALPKSMVMILRGQTQLSPSNLPGMVQFQLGGTNTVRGFSEGVNIGDNGYLISTELRFPLYKMPKVIKDRFQGVAFFEHGYTAITGDNKDRDARGTPGALSGAGVGLRGQLLKKLTGRVDIGFTWNRKEGQNFRVHFGLDSQLF